MRKKKSLYFPYSKKANINEILNINKIIIGQAPISKGGRSIMDFYRASEKDFSYIKYKKSLIHNTALIACEEEDVVATLEYKINNIEEAEVINFNIFESSNENIAIKGLIEEIVYWIPYLRRIIYNENNNILSEDILKYTGFRKDSIWIFEIDNNIEVFKVDMEKITHGQLTVSEVKVDKVSTWIRKPENIVITCVKIDNKMVCIDGHSRLVAAHIKGFKYVYAYFETDTDNIEFYKTCMEWCKKQNIFSIKDLTNRIVTPEEHERLWINRCQTYLELQ